MGIDSRWMSTVWIWQWIEALDMHDFVHKGEGVSEQGQGILPGETYCCYTEFWPSGPCAFCIYKREWAHGH